MSTRECPTIDVVGVDDSGPECLTAGELALIERATLICGGARHLALFPSACAERFTIAADLDALCGRLAGHAAYGAVVLASGDPCFFGVGPLLAERFGREHVRIHPRPSSVSTAFARLGLAWQDATVLSVHGRPVKEAVPAALSAVKIAILTDPEHTPAVVADALISAGMQDCPAYVCERLGGTAEHIHELTLNALPDQQFDPVNVLILLPGQRAPCRHGIGRPDVEYASVRGQITKAEVRTIALTRLEPWNARVCWDVGAASGSVSIEMASLMSAPVVYAVERDDHQIAAMRQNVRGHSAAGVHIVHGLAPAALESLPEPDCVFVGGGGPALLPILRLAAERLSPAGRLVANFALLESLSAWQAFAASTGWPSDIVKIEVARGVALAGGTHLAPLGPVFVTRLTKQVRGS